AASPAAAAAPAVNIRPAAEADEFAARTTRLLGRFRVQARSAASAPAQPASVMDTQLRVHDEATPEPAAELAEAPQESSSEAQPEGLIGAQPEGLIGAQPEGLIGAQPEGLIEAQPEGLIEARPEPEPASPTE